jgi:hypothetical protein
MNAQGYSGTPLARKLGIGAGMVVSLVNEPTDYFSFFSPFPEGVQLTGKTIVTKDLIHYFPENSSRFYNELPLLKKEMKPDGMIWVSWPKKTAKMKSDLDENSIRSFALEIGLVDVKVCAVNATWSALKLVIPLKDRKKV